MNEGDKALLNLLSELGGMTEATIDSITENNEFREQLLLGFAYILRHVESRLISAGYIQPRKVTPDLVKAIQLFYGSAMVSPLVSSVRLTKCVTGMDLKACKDLVESIIDKGEEDTHE